MINTDDLTLEQWNEWMQPMGDALDNMQKSFKELTGKQVLLEDILEEVLSSLTVE